jgi:hypothetical protein
MPIIHHFNAERVREAVLPPLTDKYAGEVAIGHEDADECEGVRCGERLEAALSSEEYARYLDSHAERPPLAPHSHMIVRGREPQTRSLIFAVFKG